MLTSTNNGRWKITRWRVCWKKQKKQGLDQGDTRTFDDVSEQLGATRGLTQGHKSKAMKMTWPHYCLGGNNYPTLLFSGIKKSCIGKSLVILSLINVSPYLFLMKERGPLPHIQFWGFNEKKCTHYLDWLHANHYILLISKLIYDYSTFSFPPVSKRVH